MASNSMEKERSSPAGASSRIGLIRSCQWSITGHDSVAFAASGQRDGDVRGALWHLHDVLVSRQTGFGLLIQGQTQTEKRQHREAGEEYQRQPKRYHPAEGMADIIRRRPVRSEAAALSFQIGNLIAETGNQITQLFAAIKPVFAFESQQQAIVINLQRGQSGRTLGSQIFQIIKEVLTRQVIAKQAQLQRMALPFIAKGGGLRQDDFVHSRAKSVFGGIDVFGGYAALHRA